MNVHVTDNKNISSDLEDDSFANGLRALFTRGEFCKKCRLNNKIKNILSLMLNETSEDTCFMEESQFELFMQAKIWINKQIGLSSEKQILTARLAGFIYHWMNVDFKYYPFDNENDYNQACEWIMNKLSDKYSVSEMTIGSDEKIRK
jgi:hypothetical protein